jgi:hypothetical protein
MALEVQGGVEGPPPERRLRFRAERDAAPVTPLQPDRYSRAGEGDLLAGVLRRHPRGRRLVYTELTVDRGLR